MTMEQRESLVAIDVFGHPTEFLPAQIPDLIKSGRVPLGPVLKNLHLLPEENWPPIIDLGQEIQARFWEEWGPFRIGIEGDEGGRSFEYSMGAFDLDRHPFGIRGLFAQFIELKKDTPTLVVDIGGGRAAMLNALIHEYDEKTLAGYLVFDTGGFVEKEAKEEFGRLKMVERARFECLDLLSGQRLPIDKIKAIVEEIEADEVRFITSWAGTYFPKQIFEDWVNQALSIRESGAKVAINMLSGKRYDPDNLRKGYEIMVEGHVAAGRMSREQAVAAYKSAGRIVEFGKAIASVAPIWTPEEVSEMLNVTKMEDGYMKGQTIFLMVE